MVRLAHRSGNKSGNRIAVEDEKIMGETTCTGGRLRARQKSPIML
jgi:hypothetical protein